jgi:hypothetical protein
MATQKVKREMVIQTVEQCLDIERLPVTAETAVGSKEGKVSFLNRVADALWKMSCGLSFVGFFLPLEPAFRQARSLSSKEKAEIEAYQRGF